jgi:multiple sugar transport system ATP-binding protein
VNLFVAGFIGSPAMNLLPGRVEDGGVRVLGALLPVPPGVPVVPGRAVVYGIRPEHLRLSGDGIAATVSVVEPTGSETLLHLRAEGGHVLTGLLRERHALVPGQVVHLAPDAAAVHLFDPAEGGRIG